MRSREARHTFFSYLSLRPPYKLTAAVRTDVLELRRAVGAIRAFVTADVGVARILERIVAFLTAFFHRKRHTLYLERLVVAFAGVAGTAGTLKSAGTTIPFEMMRVLSSSCSLSFSTSPRT